MRRLVVFNQLSVDGYFVDAHGDMSWAKDGADDEPAQKSPAPADKSAADGTKAEPHKPATKKRR